MWLVETCEHCVVCAGVTPHTRRRAGVAALAASSLGALAVACAWSLGDPILGALAGYATLWIGLRSREHHLGIASDRCRAKARARERTRRPDPRDSTIDVL